MRHGLKEHNMGVSAHQRPRSRASLLTIVMCCLVLTGACSGTRLGDGTITSEEESNQSATEGTRGPGIRIGDTTPQILPAAAGSIAPSSTPLNSDPATAGVDAQTPPELAAGESTDTLDPKTTTPSSAAAPAAAPAASGPAPFDWRTGSVQDSVVEVRSSGCVAPLAQIGSGFVVAPGTIVTSAHIIRGATAITIRGGDQVARRAELIAFNEMDDLAVLRVQGLDAPAVTLGTPTVGTAGESIGYSQGIGLISRPMTVKRIDVLPLTSPTEPAGTTHSIMQLNSSAAAGESGSPVFSTEGLVVGMVQLGVETEGATWAVTTNEIRNTLSSLSATPVSSGLCQ